MKQYIQTYFICKQKAQPMRNYHIECFLAYEKYDTKNKKKCPKCVVVLIVSECDSHRVHYPPVKE